MKLVSLSAIVGITTIGLMAAGNIDRATAATITLYDGSSGVTPNNITNPYLSFANIGGGSQTASGGVTTLNTSVTESSYAGYSNYLGNTLVNSLFPALDSTTGYTLSFTIKVNAQTNNGANGAYRAGFSIIALDSNKKGVEIGFRNSDIFAQPNASFNSIDSTEQKTAVGTLLSNLTTYDLNVLGNSYTLVSGGNTILTGSLKDYTSAVGPFSNVYRTKDFLFFGDDTTSAGASVDIKNITLITNTAAVPEPSSMLGAAMAIGCGTFLKRKLRLKSNNKYQRLGIKG